MSFVLDQVRRVDLQLDRLQLSSSISLPVSPALRSHGISEDNTAGHAGQSASISALHRITQLQSLIKLLSTTSSSTPVLKPSRVRWVLEQAQLPATSRSGDIQEIRAYASYEEELEWLLISKATVQIYGLILNTLLDQTLPLSNDIWYWDEVLGSYRYTVLYSIQTSPWRLWKWSNEIYRDAKRRLESLQESIRQSRAGSDKNQTHQVLPSLAERWSQFYGFVRDSVRDRSVADLQRRVVSPFALSRTEAKQKQARLRKLRELSATGLGILMNESLSFDVDDDGGIITKGQQGSHAATTDQDEWKSVVEKSVALMDVVLWKVTSLEIGIGDFEDAVFSSVENDSDIVEQGAMPDGLTSKSRTAVLSKRLQEILDVRIPSHVSSSQSLATQYGRPSRIVRYWLPATVLLLSSSTILRIAVRRKAEIITWIQDFGRTMMDFWFNWVVEPTKKILATIRHDKDSEVALMSRRSLEGDRASLERMVVDFAIDHPSTVKGGGSNRNVGSLSEAEITEIRGKVREGDLTPVLMAYERDLRSPLKGTIRGDLIRTLLIQIQKTKVDVEVAIGGIDSLLKSQELVFGFVGLTPGILVCLGVSRWLGGLWVNRRGVRRGRQQGKMLRVLRNIDRILTASTSSNNGMLTYKEHGLLLCEVDLFRKLAKHAMPGDVHREFVEEVDDLVDIRTGVESQLKVVERIRWAYAKWLR